MWSGYGGRDDDDSDDDSKDGMDWKQNDVSYTTEWYSSEGIVLRHRPSFPHFGGVRCLATRVISCVPACVYVGRPVRVAFLKLVVVVCGIVFCASTRGWVE